MFVDMYVHAASVEYVPVAPSVWMSSISGALTGLLLRDDLSQRILLAQEHFRPVIASNVYRTAHYNSRSRSFFPCGDAFPLFRRFA